MMPKTRPLAAALAALLLALLIGCTGPVFRPRSQSPELSDGEDRTGETRLVGDFAVPYGVNYIKLEGPVLITGLKGTGSDPPPGPQRAALLADMQARKVQKPNMLLADPNNSLAWARCMLPPGVQKGDRVDVEVRVTEQSDTSSLSGGWMMETHLQEMAVLGGQVREGRKMALAQGPVLVDPASQASADAMALKKGVVLGGAIAQESRPLALVLKPEEKSVYRSKQIGDALNRRFHTYNRGLKQGIANPQTDSHVKLLVHPRYKQNLVRYFRVIRAVPVAETPSQQLARLEQLERQLLDPVTAQNAAIKLEAIGKEAISTLEKGLQSDDPEVRFYSAEALAYLDQPSSAPALAEAARKEPAFRAFALAALCALNDVHAADALRELFDTPSAETRYGAFRALWAMNPNDPSLRGEYLNNRFWLHVIPSAGPPMVHVTHSYRPEVLIFGEGQRFEKPIALEAGNSIIVKSQADGQIRVSRFAVREADRHQTVSNSIEDVVRAIAEVGGDYPDVVHALQQARSSGALVSRFEVDAVPARGRAYDRSRKLAGRDGADESNLNSSAEGESGLFDEDEDKAPSMPLPTLFGGETPTFSKDHEISGSGFDEAVSAEEAPEEVDSDGTAETAGRRKRFWQR